jgi:tetratricopeptide (TPR) repeat protein
VASLSVQPGRYETADRAFCQLIEDFDDKDVLYEAGTYFQSRGDFERARSCYRRLIEDDPGDVEARTRLTELAAADGDLHSR